MIQIKKYLGKHLIVFLIVVFISSCSNKVNQIDPLAIATPDIGVSTQDNDYLEVTAPNGWNSFKTDKPISLMIRNISDKQIVAKQDFGARIFVLDKDKWVEVKNKTVYSNDPIILEPSKVFDPTKITGIFILPDLADNSTSFNIRIFIVGNVIENGEKAKEVTSYIDLKLNP